MTLLADPSRRTFPLVSQAGSGAPTGGNRIADLTHRPRLGLRGPGTRDWCARHGLPFPDAINRVAQTETCRVARLGQFELLILSDSDTPLPEAFHDLPARTVSGYREDSWAWFRIEGQMTLIAMSRMTSADLRGPATAGNSVFQTRLAGLDSVLLVGGADKLDIFADIASSHYLLDVFKDRCPEFAVELTTRA